MVEVTKEEKTLIQKILPNTCVVRTMKQRSGRHHYYCEESERAMELLNDIRSGNDISEGKEKYGNRKKRRRNSPSVS